MLGALQSQLKSMKVSFDEIRISLPEAPRPGKQKTSLAKFEKLSKARIATFDKEMAKHKRNSPEW